MSTIDIHTHAFPDKIAARAISGILKSGESAGLPDWRAFGNGKVKGLVKSMDKADIDMSCLYGIATKPGQVSSIVSWLDENHTDRIVPVGSIHPEDENPRNWIKAMHFAGFPAIKLHPMYQDFVIDEERMFPIYEAALEFDLGIVFHAGQDVGYLNDAVADRAAPHRIANLLEKFPGIKILAAHMGGWRMWDAVREYLIGKDVYLETSFALQFMGEESFVEMIKSHRPDRVCFGTDWPWGNQKTYRKQVMDLLAGDPVLRDKVMFSNAAKFIKF